MFFFFTFFLIFLSSLFILIYLSVAILVSMNLNRDQGVKKDPSYTPEVSLVICAYNEEKIIADKIENTLQIDYPRGKFETILFDNGSEDKTFEVATSFKERGIKVLKLNGKNRGKSAGLNEALKNVTGNIIKVSDADCLYEKDILHRIVPYFADPSVGAVAASPVLINPKQSAATKVESGLQTFYHFLYGAWSVLDSIVIGGGGLAFRKELIKNLDEEIGADDIQIAVKVRKSGYRVLFLKDAHFHEFIPPTFRARWKQKIRRSAQIVQALIKHRDLMFKRRYGIYGMVIYPAEFFMRVLSPYILLTIICLGVFILFLSFWEMIKIILYISVASIATGLLMNIYFNHSAQSAGHFSLLHILPAFLDAQLVLLLGSLSLLWRKPHTWKPTRETKI